MAEFGQAFESGHDRFKLQDGWFRKVLEWLEIGHLARLSQYMLTLR